MPVTTKAKRQAANQFRHFLQQDGYEMLQLSVYSRIVRGRDMLQKHYTRLQAHLPSEGNVRCLEVTEKQFVSMKMLIGNPSPREKKVNSEQLLLF